MQREACHDGVEARGRLELLQAHPPEDGAGGRLGIDCDHLVPCGGESRGEFALTASDLEDPSRRAFQPGEGEGNPRGTHKRMMEPTGLEPVPFALPARRSPN